MALLFIFLSFFGVSDQTWDCRNQVEVTCADGKCLSTGQGEFTPMSISFSESGEISVCAYSGCWEGTGDIMFSKQFLTLSTKELPFSTNKDSKQSVSLTLDKNDNIGVLKAGEFAQPIVCKLSRDK